MSEQIQKFINNYGPYLNDLWRRLYITTIIFFIFFVVGFFSAGYIVEFFIKFFDFTQVSIVVTSPFQFLDLAMDIGMFVAIFVSTPVLIWQLYAFIRPAVSKTEFKNLLLFIPLALVLFIVGFAYGFLAMYTGLKVLANVNVSFGLKNLWDVSLFLSQLTITSTLLGILFQFPIVISILIRMQIMSRQFLKEKRRVAYALIIILVALLPPTDGFSLVIMAVPMVLLYELTILFNWGKKNAVVRADIVGDVGEDLIT